VSYHVLFFSIAINSSFKPLAIWDVEWHLQVSQVLILQEKQSEPNLHCHQLHHQDLLRNLEGV